MPPLSPSSFSLRSMIRDLLTVHEQRSFTDFYCSGGSHTTPHLCSIDAQWQFPWRSLLLMMNLLFFALVFMIFEHVARIDLGNTKLFACAIFMQSIAIPLGLVCVFAEFNLWRNLSWLRIISMIFGGGLLAIMFTLVLSTFDRGSSPFMAALIEEPAKIAAALLLAGGVSRRNASVLNGLLFGGAVGAGFSIVETSGYAFESLYAPVHAKAGEELSFQSAYTLMTTRSFFSLTAGHVTWTAITCGALWNSMRGRSLSKALIHPSFLFFLFVAIVIHGYWNISTSNGAIILMLPLFALCSWGLISVLIHTGIQQIHEIQELWFRRVGRSKPCVWLTMDSGIVRGPYTAQEIIERVDDGRVSRCQSCCIGSPHAEAHSVAKLSFISSRQNDDSKCWYHIERPAWLYVCRILGLLSFLSIACFLIWPRLTISFYLICAFSLFAILITMVLKLWQSPHLPTEPYDKYGSLIWVDSPQELLAKFLIPGYNLYWGYIVGTHLIRRVNLLHTGAQRIPSWIPQLFWTTFSTGLTLAGVLLFYDTHAFLPYLMMVIILFPLSAALCSVALASAQSTLENPPPPPEENNPKSCLYDHDEQTAGHYYQ